MTTPAPIPAAGFASFDEMMAIIGERSAYAAIATVMAAMDRAASSNKSESASAWKWLVKGK